MVLKALEKHGELTIEELAQITGRPKVFVEMELHNLRQQGKVCIDKDGVCYISPKTSFPSMLLVTFLVFICSWFLVGAMFGKG